MCPNQRGLFPCGARCMGGGAHGDCRRRSALKYVSTVLQLCGGGEGDSRRTSIATTGGGEMAIQCKVLQCEVSHQQQYE